MQLRFSFSLSLSFLARSPFFYPSLTLWPSLYLALCSFSLLSLPLRSLLFSCANAIVADDGKRVREKLSRSLSLILSLFLSLALFRSLSLFLSLSLSLSRSLALSLSRSLLLLSSLFRSPRSLFCSPCSLSRALCPVSLSSSVLHALRVHSYTCAKV